MKKIYSKLLRAVLRANSKALDPVQKSINEKVAASIQKWIEDKGYCKPDQSIADVAAIMGVSEEALSYYCTSVFGERFTSVRKKLRIAEAHRLIEADPSKPLSSIAYTVGIHDKCNFRRQFYEVYACPPSHWQKECRAKKQ